MTPENFIYWLQGKLEIGDTKTLNEQEVQVIKDHINLVLKKETPVRLPLIVADPKVAPGTIEFRMPLVGPASPSLTQPSCSCAIGRCRCVHLTATC